jgi:hypothetical protein
MAATPRAIDFLRNEVSLAQQQLKSFSDQMESLAAQKEAVEYKLAALIGKLKEVGGEPLPTIDAGSQSDEAVRLHGAPSLDGGKVGLREAIRLVLRSSAQPMKARAIADKLPSVGLRYEAKLPLPARVRNELTRMTAEKQVMKRNKAYTLAQEWQREGDSH